MARNGSGTYTVPNTLVSGTTITASDHNENYGDLGDEVTNSVAADGQTSMTGPLKHSSGTAPLPSMTFAADTNTGFFRSSADEIGVALGGVAAFTISDDDIVTSAGLSLFPLIGEIRMWALPTAPTGWFFMRGQAVGLGFPLWRAALIAAGNPYGVSGSDPLLPNMQCRLPAGFDADGLALLTGSTVLGASLGAQTKQLSTANLPAYTPAGTIVDSRTFALSTNYLGTHNGVNNDAPGSGTNASFRSGTITPSGSQPAFTGTAQGGTSTAFSIVQPSIILNFIGRAA